MNRQRWLAAAACTLAVTVLVAVAILSAGGAARGSAVSRGPGGWLAARRYLEARGARVTLVTEPLGRWVAAAGDGPRGRGTLALVFPWQGPPAEDLSAALDRHLGRGGDLVIAYSGELAGDEKDLDFWRAGEPVQAPVNPWRWYQFVQRQWDLRPPPLAAGAAPRPQGSAGKAAPGPAVRIWAPRVVPAFGTGAEVLYTSPAGQPVAWIFRRHGGRVVVLPADALANARLARPGNANLLEALLQNLGNRWAFDEYHHGLSSVLPAAPELGRAADLLTVHLVLLYLLAIASLARRQGPAWPAEASIASSAPGFLLGIGALHDRLGHHRAAALLLLRRVRELDRGVELPPELDRQAETAGAKDLVTLAREVARLRR